MDKSLEKNIKEIEKDFYQTYLSGLAYLGGVDIEKDAKKGLTLIKQAAECGLEVAMRKMIEIYLEGILVKKSLIIAKEWYDRLIEEKEEKSNTVDEMISLFELYDEYCNFLNKARYYVSFPIFAKEKMLPMAERYVNRNESVYWDPKENTILFWLCKSYYWVVFAEMQLDANNYHAKEYSELIKIYKKSIIDDDYLPIINECLEYVEKAKTFWNEIDLFLKKERSKKENEEKQE